MAIDFGNKQQNTSNNGRGFRKAAAFINQYVPTSAGRTKLGTIPLYDDNERHVQLMQWLRATPENINKLYSGIVQSEVVFVDNAVQTAELILE